MKDEKSFTDFFKEIEKADSNGASFDELSGRMEDFMREALKNECPKKLAEFDALQKEADEFVENERANRGKTRKKKHNYSAYADKLEKSIKGKNTLDELIEAFRETSKMKINGVNEEDDELLFSPTDSSATTITLCLPVKFPPKRVTSIYRLTSPSDTKRTTKREDLAISACSPPKLRERARTRKRLIITTVFSTRSKSRITIAF